MKNYKIRKRILLGAAVILLAAYVVLLVFNGTAKTKTLIVKNAITKIVIENPLEPNGTIELFKNGDAWFLGQMGFPVKQNLVEKMSDELKELVLIGEAAKSAENDNRFGIDPLTSINVKAYADGKLIRTVVIGKNTSTGNQSYVCVDEKSTVYLTSGALRNVFQYTIDELVEKPEQEE